MFRTKLTNQLDIPIIRLGIEMQFYTAHINQTTDYSKVDTSKKKFPKASFR